MTNIAIPKKLTPLINAFSASEETAKLLIIEAVKAINSNTDSAKYCCKSDISSEEIYAVLEMMKDIDPIDTLEMIYGAQIIFGHLMGLQFLSHSFTADQHLGIKLLKFTNEAIGSLQKKRLIQTEKINKFNQDISLCL